MMISMADDPDDEFVRHISGHKNLSMVEHYSRQNGVYIESAMDKLSERYRKAS